MKFRFSITAGAVFGLVAVTFAHDLFLKGDTFFLPPNSKAGVRFLNGSFLKSESPIARIRFRDVRIVSPSRVRMHPKERQFADDAHTTTLNFETAEAGTYVIGASTWPKEIELKAKDFNHYLQHDGIPDILAERKQSHEMNKDVRERYSKHGKALFQAGDRPTASYKTVFHYPVEIIPLENPYALQVGQRLRFLCVKRGRPIAHQFVMAGWEREGRESSLITARTNPRGIGVIRLASPGKWYIKFIHMTPMHERGFNYESQWATLTFEVRSPNLKSSN